MTTLSLLVAMGAGTGSHAAVIELRRQASVEPAAMIRLQDIAQLSAADAAVLAKLGSIPLSPAPSGGRSVQITYEEVRSCLQAHGVNLLELEFRGQARTEVRTTEPRAAAPARVVPAAAEEPRPATTAVVRPAAATAPPPRYEAAKVEESVTTALRRAFRITDDRAAKLRITCQLADADVRRLKSVSHEHLRFAEPQIAMGNGQKLTVRWTAADGSQQEAKVEIGIAEVPVVLTVKQSMPVGAVVRPEDLTWGPPTDPEKGVRRLADVIGKEVTRNLRAGQVITPDDLMDVPLVRSNDIVSVLVRKPGIVVKRPFKALSSGALNDTVNLVAVDDPRLRVQATVTGYHEATLSDAETTATAPLPVAPATAAPATVAPTTVNSASTTTVSRNSP